MKMTKNIGLSQKLKFSWLEKTVEIVSSEEDTFIKKKISEYLSCEIKSPTNIRKITKILMNIWVSNNNDLQINALELIKKYPEYSLVINWCLILTAYPVFTDICTIIGKIAKFQEVITNNQIKEKMFEEWGERSTLFYSVEKTLGTIIELGALKPIKKGSYSLCKYAINNDEIIDFMLKSILLSNTKESSKTINELQNLACFFPFKYKINENRIINNNSFKTVNLGGNLNISVA